MRRGRGSRAVGVPLLAALAASQVALVVLNPVLPEIAGDLGVSVATAGQLRTVSGLAAGAATVAFGGYSALGLAFALLFVGIASPLVPAPAPPDVPTPPLR